MKNTIIYTILSLAILMLVAALRIKSEEYQSSLQEKNQKITELQANSDTYQKRRSEAVVNENKAIVKASICNGIKNNIKKELVECKLRLKLK